MDGTLMGHLQAIAPGQIQPSNHMDSSSRLERKVTENESVEDLQGKEFTKLSNSYRLETRQGALIAVNPLIN